MLSQRKSNFNQGDEFVFKKYIDNSNLLQYYRHRGMTQPSLDKCCPKSSGHDMSELITKYKKIIDLLLTIIIL